MPTCRYGWVKGVGVKQVGVGGRGCVFRILGGYGWLDLSSIGSWVAVGVDCRSKS